MMTTGYLFLMMLPGQYALAQKEPVEALSEYHKLPRETIFVHLNKTTYVQGEEIWFAGYVYNRKEEKPFVESTNIQVGIYDENGKQLKKGRFLGNQGHFKGSFALDSTYTAGKYYVKAQTSWLRNFKEEEAFVQQIEVLTSDTPEKLADSGIAKWDTQFLPEGGHIVADLSNTIGVKVLDDSGYGVPKVSGRILDSKGTLVTNFGTNEFGMGKFIFNALVGEQYKAIYTGPNGKEISQNLPAVEEKGFNITLRNNPTDSKVIFVFNSNESTLSQTDTSGFYFLVHKDGLSNKIPVKFDPTSYKASFVLDKGVLLPGVNTITLFNASNTPILERMFFVKTQGNPAKMEAWAGSYSNGDSLNINVSGQISDAILSVSVLPSDTKGYNPEENILSTVLLSPYLKGHVENPKYYFENETPKTAFDLDLLLLNQGWSRFDWTDVMTGVPTSEFPFEDGIAIMGTLNAPKIKNEGQIFLKDTKYHGSQFIAVNPENPKFLLTSFFPENEENLSFSFVNKRGKFQKPSLAISMGNTLPTDRINTLWKDRRYTESEIELDPIIRSQSALDKTIFLDEVVLTEEKKASSTNPNVPTFLKDRVSEITSQTVFQAPTIIDLLRNNGYDVRTTLPNTSEEISAGNFDRVRIASRRDGRTPLVYLDGTPLPSLDILYNLPTGQLESFYIDKVGSREGVRGGLGEIIYLYTRRGKELGVYEGNAQFNQVFSYEVKNGFEKEKEFYLPKYKTFFDQAFEDFGVVHWEPKLILDASGKGNFTILNTGKKEITLFIEGMSKEGKLISAVQRINLDGVLGN